MAITVSDVLRRAVPVSAVLAALTAGAVATSPAAASVPDTPSARAATGDAALTLPAPRGGPVGTATLHLVDRSRRDPWTHAGRREVMLSAFYPARRASSSPARYLTPVFANAFAAGIEVPAAPLRALRMHAAVGVAPRRGRHPVVVVAPGAIMTRTSMTLVAEDLAAHGYVALAIDHPGDAAAVELTRGRIRPVAPSLLAGLEGGKAIPKAVRVRRDDVRFLLDRLPALNRRGRLHGLLDPSRVAMVASMARARGISPRSSNAGRESPVERPRRYRIGSTSVTFRRAARAAAASRTRPSRGAAAASVTTHQAASTCARWWFPPHCR